MNYIDLLQLTPHPEGGYYRETYGSETPVTINSGQVRPTCTAIYYLLRGKEKSHLHRIQSDEIWFFHIGEPVEIFWIEKGEIQKAVLGNRIDRGEAPQIIIPAKTWFGAQIADSQGFSLMSCTVSPGFNFLDFELGYRDELIATYPHLLDTIVEFTRI